MNAPQGHHQFQPQMQAYQNMGQVRQGQPPLGPLPQEVYPGPQTSFNQQDLYNEQLVQWTIKKGKQHQHWYEVQPRKQQVSLSNLQRELKSTKIKGTSVQRTLNEITSDAAYELVHNLVDDENQKLWVYNPGIEWKIAAVELKWKDIDRKHRQLKCIDLILKTEPRPGTQTGRVTTMGARTTFGSQDPVNPGRNHGILHEGQVRSQQEPRFQSAQEPLFRPHQEQQFRTQQEQPFRPQQEPPFHPQQEPSFRQQQEPPFRQQTLRPQHEPQGRSQQEGQPRQQTPNPGQAQGANFKMNNNQGPNQQFHQGQGGGKNQQGPGHGIQGMPNPMPIPPHPKAQSNGPPHMHGSAPPPPPPPPPPHGGISDQQLPQNWPQQQQKQQPGILKPGKTASFPIEVLNAHTQKTHKANQKSAVLPGTYHKEFDIDSDSYSDEFTGESTEDDMVNVKGARGRSRSVNGSRNNGREPSRPRSQSRSGITIGLNETISHIRTNSGLERPPMGPHSVKLGNFSKNQTPKSSSGSLAPQPTQPIHIHVNTPTLAENNSERGRERNISRPRDRDSVRSFSRQRNSRETNDIRRSYERSLSSSPRQSYDSLPKDHDHVQRSRRRPSSRSRERVHGDRGRDPIPHGNRRSRSRSLPRPFDDHDMDHTRRGHGRESSRSPTRGDRGRDYEQRNHDRTPPRSPRRNDRDTDHLHRSGYRSLSSSPRQSNYGREYMQRNHERTRQKSPRLQDDDDMRRNFKRQFSRSPRGSFSHVDKMAYTQPLSRTSSSDNYSEPWSEMSSINHFSSGESEFSEEQYSNYDRRRMGKPIDDYPPQTRRHRSSRNVIHQVPPTHHSNIIYDNEDVESVTTWPPQTYTLGHRPKVQPGNPFYATPYPARRALSYSEQLPQQQNPAQLEAVVDRLVEKKLRAQTHIDQTQHRQPLRRNNTFSTRGTSPSATHGPWANPTYPQAGLRTVVLPDGTTTYGYPQ